MKIILKNVQQITYVLKYFNLKEKSVQKQKHYYLPNNNQETLKTSFRVTGTNPKDKSFDLALSFMNMTNLNEINWHDLASLRRPPAINFFASSWIKAMTIFL